MAHQITISDALLTRLRELASDKTGLDQAEEQGKEFRVPEASEGDPEAAYDLGCADGEILLARSLIAEIDKVNS